MGHDPHGRRHSTPAWLSLVTAEAPIVRGRKLVVQLVETRPIAAQSFDDRKQRIEQELERKKFKDYIDDLMRNAQITKNLDQGAAGSSATTPAAPAAAPAVAPAAPASTPPPKN